MLIEKHIPNRQKDEHLVLFLRRHGITIVSHWLFYCFLAAIPVGIYFFLDSQFPELLAGPISYPFLLLLASIYCLYILLFFFNAFLDYNLDVWIVTDKRIIGIEQRGLFNREIAEHGLDKIQDVAATQQGIFSTIFGYGDVHVQTAAEVQRFVFRQVKKPFDVVKTINHLLKNVFPQQMPPGAQYNVQQPYSNMPQQPYQNYQGQQPQQNNQSQQPRQYYQPQTGQPGQRAPYPDQPTQQPRTGQPSQPPATPPSPNNQPPNQFQ